MEDYANVRLVEILHKLGLTEQMVQEHVFRPDYLKDAALIVNLHEAGDGDDESISPTPFSGLFYRLNYEKLSRDLHNLLSGCTIGYSMQLRRYGRILFDEQSGVSKMPGDSSLMGVHWTSSTPMHVASVSKLITAIALTKLLYSRNISPDSHIIPWLPKYWNKGPGVDKITFRQLLTHTSGLVLLNEPGQSDFQFMKEQIALGTVGKPGYRNMNFGLCRILISTIDAPFLFDLLPTVNDAYWDITTIRYYTQYITENIFAPVGVTSTLDHTEPNALAYPIPVAVPGWNSRDLTTMCGGVGWHLSVDDLLTIMAAFRRRGTFVDSARAQVMLDRQFGLDSGLMRDTPLGRIYAKGGFWSNGHAVEQTNVFFLPKGMELAILANSPFCQPGGAFMNKVLDMIEDNIENLMLTAAVMTISAVVTIGLFRKTLAVNKKR